MISLTIGTNTKRKKITVPPTMTLREALEQEEINYSVGTLHLDGAALVPGDLDKSFEDLGITDKTYLISVVKADNA